MAVSGEVLRAAREAAGLSLSALALRTAYAKPYLSQIETGKRRVLEAHVRAYAQALGLSAEVMAGCSRQGASQTLADLEAALSEARGVEGKSGVRVVLWRPQWRCGNVQPSWLKLREVRHFLQPSPSSAMSSST